MDIQLMTWKQENDKPVSKGAFECVFAHLASQDGASSTDAQAAKKFQPQSPQEPA